MLEACSQTFSPYPVAVIATPQSISPCLMEMIAAGRGVEWAAPSSQTYRWTLAAGTFTDIGKKIVPSELPEDFSAAAEEMRSYKDLADGWDGADSMSVDAEKVDGALAFLARLPRDIPAPEASAAGDGTVDWFWRNDKHAATITFYSRHRAAFFVLGTAGGVKGPLDLDQPELPAKLIEGLRNL